MDATNANKIVYYRIYGQHDNKAKSLYEEIYRKTYTKTYLKRVFYQKWNTNAFKFLSLEKVTLISKYGHVANSSIHREVLLAIRKEEKQSWM